ncbi:MAG TPA: DNA polymerase II large subunit [Halobacteriales archaeon]|jgi:DNA polymerase II large subunit|nr:DNA polymerase II large subunit [Halobacteriales archaeon]
MRPEYDSYFKQIESQVEECLLVAKTARKLGQDPSSEVEIPIAKDMAGRIENLLGINGLSERIRELEENMGREEIALELAKDFAEGKVGDYDTHEGIIEGAIRTAVALLTEGVVAAPLEGIDRVELCGNSDGTEFVRVFYAGPIRSAGGTAQALSVLVADYVRTILGISSYKPLEEEIERYAEEVELYARETSLQYLPSAEETKFIARNCPIMLDGEPTGKMEVSGYRDLGRVKTNKSRGGMCLVLAEGIALKAPKIERYTSQLNGIEWPWLNDLIEGKFSEVNATEEIEEIIEEIEGPKRAKPEDKYLRDIIAGRPVFSHPSRPGGFRLRYGRARNTGLSTIGIHPVTMHILDDFLAPGTQLKTEYPGKAAGVVPVDTIEGPTVRLNTGEVLRVKTVEEVVDIKREIDSIIDLGECLIGFGEFVENNRNLLPSSYVAEWWVLDGEKEGIDMQSLLDAGDIKFEDPDATQVIKWSKELKIPLHPKYTYLWHDITPMQFEEISDRVSKGHISDGVLFVEFSSSVKKILESLLIEHKVLEEIEIKDPLPFIISLGLSEDLTKLWESMTSGASSWPNAMKVVNEVSPFSIRERAPTRIGGRMGRPEKSESREMSPSVHSLFPLGESGGDRRNVSHASKSFERVYAKKGLIKTEIGKRMCTSCNVETHRFSCQQCGEKASPVYLCGKCKSRYLQNQGDVDVPCPKCGSKSRPEFFDRIGLEEIYKDALEMVNERESAFEILKGVKALTSKNKTPEPIEKGILRAKHNVSTFKDGTIRYDMTDLPVSSFRAAELGISISKLQELGYELDIKGEPLKDEKQLVPIRVQDLILSQGAAEHLKRTANFIDDLLVKYYGLDPFYKIREADDLVGRLVLGLAPHTSAAVVGRILGFTNASVGYAHPYFHAAKRRNCDGDEDCVMLLLDGLLNFSRSYLPDKRGGKMDAPLVMSAVLNPTEIDDEAQNLDSVDKYPLEFYEATMDLEHPNTVGVKLARDEIEKGKLYADLLHTHDTSNIASGPRLSAYKTLGPMLDKLDAQLNLARKIRAVDETDVAERIIEYHFLPDLLGNLRAFSRQETRCPACSIKYRRMPLSRSCRQCGGEVHLTVHQKSISKYLKAAMFMAEEFECREYTKQRLNIIEKSLKSIFENDKNKQSDLSYFASAPVEIKGEIR